jgi:hypothetical protein
MEVTRKFLTFFIILCLISHIHSIPRKKNSDKIFYLKLLSKLPKFVCDVVKDVQTKQPEMKTLFIAIDDHNHPAGTIDEICACIRDISVVIMNMKSDDLSKIAQHKIAMTVLISDNIEAVRANYLFLKDL